MPDLAAIAGMMSSIKTATDITKMMIGVHDGRVIQDKVIELNAVILSAQSSAFAANAAQSELLERVRDLERQIADMEARQAELNRYELVEFDAGGFAYAVKESMRGAEPMHHICASCYQKRQKSIMHRSTHLGTRYLRCPACKLELEHSADPNWRPVL